MRFLARPWTAPTAHGFARGRRVRSCAKVVASRLPPFAVLAATGLFGVTLPAAEPVLQRRFEVTTETGMPNLAENLRYTRRTEKRCLDLQDLSREFWMLQDVSLQDCRLVKTGQSAEEADYVLSCRGGHGTTGSASWRLGSGTIRGSLDVRLGGKNMTFYQRITATPAGTCG